MSNKYWLDSITLLWPFVVLQSLNVSLEFRMVENATECGNETQSITTEPKIIHFCIVIILIIIIITSSRKGDDDDDDDDGDDDDDDDDVI